MIKELSIQNFRSIREATLQLGRFTVLTGANNSGKSSVLYALQVLKNVVTNPNRSVDEFFNLGWLNLGGLRENILRKDEEKEVQLLVKVSRGACEIKYGLMFSSYGHHFRIQGIEPFKFNYSLRAIFPYPLNGWTSVELVDDSIIESFTWDGFKVIDTKRLDGSDMSNSTLNHQVELPIQFLNLLDVTPTYRGFARSVFNTVPINGSIFSEDEVATLLAIDKDVQAKVSFYFEKITGKRFSISIQPGMGFFYMQVREADGSFATELVNQGMGMNQIVFLLAKILYSKNRLICVDEPEIHLHPTLMEQFIRVLVEIAEKEDKQFLFSTHSEHWLMSLLAEVYEEHLAADDLKVYYLQKNDRETTIEQQEVMPNGQIKGGLKNFLEAEMRLAHRFFPVETTA